MPGKRKFFFRRTFVRVLLAFLILLLAFVIYFAYVAIDRPPEINDMSSLTIKRIDYGSNTFGYGKNWLRKSESGLWEAYIQGKPFERGVAFGQLTRELLYYQEKSFIEQIREIIPSDNYLKVLKYFIAFFNRNLDKNIPDEYKDEIYGTSFACSPEYDFVGSGYQRQLNYHAAHDIGHALQGLNMVACTSFSVWDDESKDSSLLIGRNFDFYMGDKFAENKIVCFVNPSDGYKFMMITWADMIGVVSGMNEKGLTVTINAAKSNIPGQAATPVTLLAREIIQYASTIQEAYEIAKKRRLFVSESIMIGSAIDGKTAIIEKSPDKYDIVYPETSRIICSNHFQGSTFAADKINIENIRGSDSYKRYKRVEELLNRYKTFDASGVVAVLRDQRALGDSDAGMGNQLAINQLIAHHAVVFNPGTLQVWVSTAPWQLGKFVAYDLKKIFNLNLGDIKAHHEIYSGSLTIAADTFLNTPAYLRYRQYQLMTTQLRHFKKNHDPLPIGYASAYVISNPALYLTYVHLGDYYSEMEAPDKAYTYYSFALKHELPGRDEENKLRELSEALKNKIDHDNSRN
jgi:isopenicillin-N N-acyltransferase-like protein